jgi:hypothetical protein
MWTSFSRFIKIKPIEMTSLSSAHSLVQKILPDLFIPGTIRPSDFDFFAFCNSIFKEKVRQPCVPSLTWRIRCLYLCPPVIGWPSYTSGYRVPFRRFIRLAGLRWRYSNPPPHGKLRHYNKYKFHFGSQYKYVHIREMVLEFVVIKTVLN